MIFFHCWFVFGCCFDCHLQTHAESRGEMDQQRLFINPSIHESTSQWARSVLRITRNRPEVFPQTEKERWLWTTGLVRSHRGGGKRGEISGGLLRAERRP